MTVHPAPNAAPPMAPSSLTHTLKIGAPAWPGQLEGKAPPEGWVQLSVAAEPPAPAQEQPGWKLVPVEPTEAMMHAAMQREDDEPLTDWGKIIAAPMLKSTKPCSPPPHPRRRRSEMGEKMTLEMACDALKQDIRHLIYLDTQFNMRGETDLKLAEMQSLESRGWVTEGDENSEYTITYEGERIIAAHLATPAQTVDIEAVREVIAEMRHPTKQNFVSEWADKLTAALTEKGK